MIAKITAGLAAIAAVFYALFRVEKSKRKSAEKEAQIERSNREFLERERMINDKIREDTEVWKEEQETELKTDLEKLKALKYEDDSATTVNSVLQLLNNDNKESSVKYSK